MRIVYKLSLRAIKQELKKGNEASIRQEMEIDLSGIPGRERELLVGHGQIKEGEISFLNGPVEADSLGYEGLLQAIKEKEAKDVERSQAEGVLHDWAKEHGSGLLKQQVQNNFDWKPLARKEYLDHLQPEGWFEPKGYHKKWVVSAPDRQQMQAWKAAGQLCQRPEFRDPAVWGFQFQGSGSYPGRSGIVLKPEGRDRYVLYAGKVTIFAPDNTTRVIVRPVDEFR